MKRALDVTTKGWDKKAIDKLTQDVKSKNFKWRGKAITPDGDIKYFFSYTEIEASDFCRQQGWKFLEAKPNDL